MQNSVQKHANFTVKGFPGLPKFGLPMVLSLTKVQKLEETTGWLSGLVRNTPWVLLGPICKTRVETKSLSSVLPVGCWISVRKDWDSRKVCELLSGDKKLLSLWTLASHDSSSTPVPESITILQWADDGTQRIRHNRMTARTKFPTNQERPTLIMIRTSTTLQMQKKTNRIVGNLFILICKEIAYSIKLHRSHRSFYRTNNNHWVNVASELEMDQTLMADSCTSDSSSPPPWKSLALLATSHTCFCTWFNAVSPKLRTFEKPLRDSRIFCHRKGGKARTFTSSLPLTFMQQFTN